MCMEGVVGGVGVCVRMWVCMSALTCFYNLIVSHFSYLDITFLKDVRIGANLLRDFDVTLHSACVLSLGLPVTSLLDQCVCTSAQVQVPGHL